MKKRFLYLLLLYGCHSAPEKNLDPAAPSVSDTAESPKPVKDSKNVKLEEFRTEPVDLRPTMPPRVDTITRLPESFEYVEPVLPKDFFNNQLPFEIVSITKGYASSTDPDSSKCRGWWKLSNAAIKRIIRNSKRIDGVLWDLGFSVLVCEKSVGIVQSGKSYNITINAGSYLRIRNADNSVIFADFKKSDRKYFLEGYKPE